MPVITPQRPPARHNGFTALELLVTVAVAAVVLGLAQPRLTSLLADARLSRDSLRLARLAHFARSEAVKRRREVVLCQSEDGRQCAPTGRHWQDGWLLFVNADGARPPQVAPGEPVLSAQRPLTRGSVLANRRAFIFPGPARRATNGTFHLCDAASPARARKVVISYTGRPRTERTPMEACP